MSGSCGCCACLAGAGQPAEPFNRPGLNAIRYRAGTHATFLDAMIRRLTIPIEPDEQTPYSLHALTTREPDDPAIAMLDAWATAADVLTFYQERIANEAYLRTATERRSLLELGRLVGYTLKPGVAASAYLAYTLDEGAKTVIPAGSKSQSIPGANEQPQTFETSQDIEARGDWNALRPRTLRPQQINVDLLDVRVVNNEPQFFLVDNVLEIDSVWIEGTSTHFEKRDLLLFVFEGALLGENVRAVRRVLKTVVDTEHDRTQLVLEPVRPYYVELFRQALVHRDTVVVKRPASGENDQQKKGPNEGVASKHIAVMVDLVDELLRQILLGTTRSVLRRQFAADSLPINEPDLDAPPELPVPGTFGSLFNPLIAAPGRAPRNEFQVARSLDRSLGGRSDVNLRLLSTFHPELGTTVHTALANVTAGNRPYNQFQRLFVLRRQASVFGYNAPNIPSKALVANHPELIPVKVDEDAFVLNLDTPDERITTGSYAVVRSSRDTRVVQVLETETVSRAGYGISGRTSRLTIDRPWIDDNDLEDMPDGDGDANGRIDALTNNLEQIRRTSVSVESEELTLAQRSVDRPVGRKADPDDPDGESETRIELASVVDGLAAGRWVIVRGERLVGGTSGVLASELAMLDNVEQQTDVGAGGKPYSILVLAPDGLAYEYKRESVEILANVAEATHGETRAEILGGGSAATPLQSFTLHHTPLTFVAAPTVDGVRSTLSVRVDGALWHEAPSLAGAAPDDRVYTSRIADDGKVTVTFGDGHRGRRLPSGTDNVRTAYRTGIGRGGDVRAGQIATAISRPLGVKEVVNPTEATGGADPESAGDARRNIPVSLQAMGRVVSVEDFANFARTFAGIGKATAKLLAADRIRFVYLTIGGSGDIPIDPHSDLYRNLVESLRKFGDPYQPFVVGVRRKIVIAGAARVRVHPDYLWSLVAPKVRAALLETFAYDRRDFGQPVFPAEVIAAIQGVPGVQYVDLDRLQAVREDDVLRTIGAIPAQSTTTSQDSLPRPAGSLLQDCDHGLAILPKFARKPETWTDPKRPPLPHEFLAAEIAYLPPELAELFILTEITHE